VTGVDHLLGLSPAVLVANHQSYVDSLVLLAVLPILPNIVVNERLPGAPLIGTGVRAARYLAVDRRSIQARLTCAGRMVDLLRAGESLLVFPEGTFPPGPGLLPFRLGAFSAAAATARPVIPITICGTRRILPWGASLLRRSDVSVTVHAPLHPGGAGWKEASRLREQAREQIRRSAE
jgi:1-acyl-sn-glycerol-3-phosphate acyltransferase